jgi:hypothetical protein
LQWIPVAFTRKIGQTPALSALKPATPRRPN